MQKQVIKFTNRSPYPNSIFIGNEDDNLARQVQFVLPSEIDGAKIYLHLSIGEYSDVIELDDNLIYVPTRTHTQYPGNWTGYLEAHADNDIVWHSNTFTFKVGDLPDSGEQIEQSYPSAIESALNEIRSLSQETELNAQQVSQDKQNVEQQIANANIDFNQLKDELSNNLHADGCIKSRQIDVQKTSTNILSASDIVEYSQVQNNYNGTVLSSSYDCTTALDIGSQLRVKSIKTNFLPYIIRLHVESQEEATRQYLGADFVENDGVYTLSVPNEDARYVRVQFSHSADNSEKMLSVNADLPIDYEKPGTFLYLNGRRIAEGVEVDNLKSNLGIWENLASKEHPDRIVCWGDSLTQNGGWTDVLNEKTGLPVVNCGIGGEKTTEIMARQGADVIMLNNITIPGTQQYFTIATVSEGFHTQLGEQIRPIIQSQNNASRAIINGVQGSFNTWNDNGVFSYFFKRFESGDDIVIDRPTAMRIYSDYTYNKVNDLNIIFMGSNGGYVDDYDTLINQHKLMIERSGSKKWIVLGMTLGNNETMAEYERKMTFAFGRRFISLRTYLTKYGMEDANLTPTEDDTTKMSIGEMPQSLLVDTIHYNDACKTVIGNLIYKRLVELGFVK